MTAKDERKKKQDKKFSHDSDKGDVEGQGCVVFRK